MGFIIAAHDSIRLIIPVKTIFFGCNFIYVCGAAYPDLHIFSSIIGMAIEMQL